MEDYIIGSIRKVIYKSDNGYVVGLFKVTSAIGEYEGLVNETLSFTGYFPDLSEEENYKFYGNIVNHPKYGEQFNVTMFEIVMPEEKDSVIEFLSSGLFKGIGERTAKKIVEHLGNDCLQRIIEDSSVLLMVPGITAKQMEVISRTLNEYSNSYSIILKLTDLGFSSRESMIIYNKYKLNTNDVIDSNLYQLIEDIKEISFKKVDYIALKNNYSREDDRRVIAAILSTMEELCFTLSHCYLTFNLIYKYTVVTLGNYLSEELLRTNLGTLALSNKVINIDEKYYLKEMFDAERVIVDRVAHLSRLKDIKIPKLDGYIEELEKGKRITYNEEQKEAIKSSIIKNFLIITGGPGTGKTTIVSSVIDLYQKVNKLSNDDLMKEVVLLAPTGRASKRLSEKSNFPAYTIHSFLKWNKETDRFAVNERNKSDAKLVIIDEASMVDVLLFYSLLKGLHDNTQIVMVGDYDQLPSVGPGQLLKDLIESDMLNVIYLRQLYRQGEDSSIITLAHDVNEGIVDKDIFNQKDLLFIKKDNVMDSLKDIVKDYINKPYQDFQILAPMYKGINGIDNLNKFLQDIFNPKSKSKKEIQVGDITYRENDKILQLVNMPDERIFNGDIGTITKIDNKEITILFDVSEVKFTPSQFNKFRHGYAISIHKSQGSEFDTVVIPVFTSYGKMLYRKLYYTAITRCKKKLIIIGDINALAMAANNNSQDIRMTTIREKLVNKLSYD